MYLIKYRLWYGSMQMKCKKHVQTGPTSVFLFCHYREELDTTTGVVYHHKKRPWYYAASIQCLLTLPLILCLGPGLGPDAGLENDKPAPIWHQRRQPQESPRDLLSTRSTFDEGNAGLSVTLLAVSAPIYFQRNLLSTNLLLTRSTFNEGSRAS